MSLLEIENLSVHYGGIEALKNISFKVEAGEIVTLIGANGAGKSTTLKSISGLVSASGGTIRHNGETISGLDSQKIVERGIVLVPEGRKVFSNLSVLENLKIGAYLRTDKAGIAEDIERMYDLFPRLKERHWQMAGTLSGGEQQMLAVGRALMAKPQILMMDEPSLGLAPLIVRDIFSIIRKINEQGTTVLLIEQNANAALKIADRGYVLVTGEVKLSGSGKDLLNDKSVQDAYLGTSAH
ncbi:MAG: ABC transporter ATP-binding protein [Clostridiales bacterium]|mgnify:CR=1 FL=1|nr:ABC transporter ATP-binding protein [Clostridiales bacterium]